MKCKRIFLLAAVLCLTLTARSQETTGPKHLVRVGWGDPLFEKLAFTPSPAGTRYDFGFSGHFFADYHYGLNKFVSVGGQADYQSICWTDSQDGRVRNHDLSIMPTLRLTWLRSEWVRLYSGLGAGMLIAWDNTGGSEAAPVFNLNSIGLQVGKGPWTGSLDLGFMASMRNANHIYFAGTRLLSVSVNYCW